MRITRSWPCWLLAGHAGAARGPADMTLTRPWARAHGERPGVNMTEAAQRPAAGTRCPLTYSCISSTTRPGNTASSASVKPYWGNTCRSSSPPRARMPLRSTGGTPIMPPQVPPDPIPSRINQQGPTGREATPERPRCPLRCRRSASAACSRRYERAAAAASVDETAQGASRVQENAGGINCSHAEVRTKRP